MRPRIEIPAFVKSQSTYTKANPDAMSYAQATKNAPTSTPTINQQDTDWKTLFTMLAEAMTATQNQLKTITVLMEKLVAERAQNGKP